MVKFFRIAFGYYIAHMCIIICTYIHVCMYLRQLIAVADFSQPFVTHRFNLCSNIEQNDLDEYAQNRK